MNLNILNMTAEEYKKYHESHMENNHGSTAVHTFLCIFFTVQCSIYCAINTRTSVAYQLIYEFIVIILPLILAHTVLADYIYILNCIISAMLFKVILDSYSKLDLRKNCLLANNFQGGKIHSITCMRSLTYLITILCILAVDFKSFPRSLAKTENYGYSLMDTGVGLFVLMSGIVHKNQNNNLSTIIKGNIKFISILLFLGIARFVSVKQLDYQEHISEYGVHWNFFFTLAICKLISIIVLLYTQHALLASIVLLGVHEYLLFIGLEEWVFSDTPRSNLLNANREGIASSLGYVTMYLFAAYLKSKLSDKTLFRYKLQIKLVLFSLLFWTLALLVNYIRPTSRTLANAGYCLYLESVLLTVMSVLYFFEVQFQGKDVHFTVPLILSAINNNGLISFLVANLCTGAINLTMRTLLASASETFLILNVYMMVTVTFVLILKYKNIRY